MSLTPQQIAVRATGIGASEVSCAAGINPYRGRTPLDLWFAKPTPSRAPLFELTEAEVEELGFWSIEEENSSPAEVGNVLEPGLAELYRIRSGAAAIHRPHETYRHPEFPEVLASPDLFVLEGERVVRLGELKVVGTRVAHHWRQGVPDYVRVQVEQQITVMRALGVLTEPVADVGRLIGTDFRIHTIRQDEALSQKLVEIVRQFWREYVQGDTPPPPSAGEDRLEYLRKRYRGKVRDILTVPPDHADFVAALFQRYIEAERAAEVAETARAHVECEIKELIADAGGIRLPGGDGFTWLRDSVGRTNWKAVAEELAPFGKVPTEMIARHRGDPARRFLYSPAKTRRR